jgi:hypothetical protein
MVVEIWRPGVPVSWPPKALSAGTTSDSLDRVRRAGKAPPRAARRSRKLEDDTAQERLELVFALACLEPGENDGRPVGGLPGIKPDNPIKAVAITTRYNSLPTGLALTQSWRAPIRKAFLLATDRPFTY